MYGRIQKLRFVAMGVSMMLAALVFFGGALLIRTLYNRIDKTHLEDAGREIRSRTIVQRQVVVADMALFQLPQYTDVLLNTQKAKALEELLPQNFDFAVYYDGTRSFVAGAYRDSRDKLPIPLKAAQMKTVMPGDSAIFDQSATEGHASGLVLFEGKPWLMGVRTIKIGAGPTGFVLAGRKLDTRRLAVTAGLSEQAFDIFVPDPRIGFPGDVDAARLKMSGDSASFTRLERRGQGVGYLRFDDVFEHTAFILRFAWADPVPSGEKVALAWLFVSAMIFGGLIHMTSSGALSWFVSQRRHNPGLGGLSDKELQLTVESFPGYAFALTEQCTYVGISRSLSGVFGKEPSDFYGKTFGAVASERGFSASEVYSKLVNSKAWPALEDVEVTIQGLAEEHQYHGVAHHIGQKKVTLYLLRKSAVAHSRTDSIKHSVKAA